MNKPFARTFHRANELCKAINQGMESLLEQLEISQKKNKELYLDNRAMEADLIELCSRPSVKKALEEDKEAEKQFIEEIVKKYGNR